MYKASSISKILMFYLKPTNTGDTSRNPRKPSLKSRIKLWRYQTIPSPISLVRNLEEMKKIIKLKHPRCQDVGVRSALQSSSTPTMTWPPTSWTSSSFGLSYTSSSTLFLLSLMLDIGLLFSWHLTLFLWLSLSATWYSSDPKSTGKSSEYILKLFALLWISIKLTCSSMSTQILPLPATDKSTTYWDTLMS